MSTHISPYCSALSRLCVHCKGWMRVSSSLEWKKSRIWKRQMWQPYRMMYHLQVWGPGAILTQLSSAAAASGCSETSLIILAEDSVLSAWGSLLGGLASRSQLQVLSLWAEEGLKCKYKSFLTGRSWETKQHTILNLPFIFSAINDRRNTLGIWTEGLSPALIARMGGALSSSGFHQSQCGRWGVGLQLTARSGFSTEHVGSWF